MCIVNWNCRDLLRACLQSLLRTRQGVSFEVIVVDNGSQDGAADLVAREFPEVILLRNAGNLGFARANNQAARRARGRYLFFLNNDTWLPPGTLRALVDYAEDHPEVGIVGPRLRDAQGHLQISWRLRPTVGTFLVRTNLVRLTGLFRLWYRRYRRQAFDPETTRRVEVLMGAAMLLPREVFFTCGGWDETFTFGGEDFDLCYRVGQRHAVMYFPGAEVRHLGRASTRQHIEYASPHIAVGFLHYLRKTGSGRLALLAYKLAVTCDAPVELATKGLQYLGRRCRGRRAEADKSLLAVRSAWYFLRRGLVPFWKG